MSEKYTYKLVVKDGVTVPVDARRIKPERFAGKRLSEILEIKVREGSRPRKLKDLFEVEGPENSVDDASKIEIVVEGEGTSKLRYLGYKMGCGRIIINGVAGCLTGYRMAGGEIIINGDARSWLGAKMKGGTIEVKGNAGDFIGAKLQGEAPGKGMKGGVIIIHGNAGSHVGAGMGGGAIIVEGSVLDLTGAHMTGGSILVMGSAGRFTGARMSGGKIVVAGRIDGVLPSFYIDSIAGSAKVKGYKVKKKFALFTGDVLVGGMGKLFIALEENKDLLSKYLELLETPENI